MGCGQSTYAVAVSSEEGKKSRMPKFAQVSKIGEGISIVERPIPEPAEGEVLIKVHACGMCHSDAFVQYGAMTPPDLYPIVPGHEVAGEVVKAGPGAAGAKFKAGDRVAVGWFGGCCHSCTTCREGETNFCETHPKITGIQRDGGYGEYVTARAEALARIPDGLEYTQAGPLVCAGVTVFNAIRHNTRYLRAGDVVATLGLGGLGHLSIQFARQMGYTSVAISRGVSKKADAIALGAQHYIDSTAGDVAAELQKLGGAKIIIVTSTGGHETLAALLPGLAVNGVMVLAGVDDKMTPIPVSALGLIPGRKSIRGTASGNSKDSEETMEFAHRFSVKVKTDVFPASEVVAAYGKMMSGKGDLRVVINFD